MLKHRLIVVLLWRSVGLVQSRQFSHTNVVGDPKVAIEFFDAWDADEIVLVNVERSDGKAKEFLNVVQYVSYHCFLPLTVGGWINSVDRGKACVAHGADKLLVNTAGFEEPKLFGELASVLGSQAVVAGIDVRGSSESGYRVCLDRNRRLTDMTPESAARLARDSGAGEIFLTSIDRDGSLKGYDEVLISRVVAEVDIPVIAFGGVGRWQDLEAGLRSGAQAVAAANIFHFSEQSTRAAKNYLRATSFPVR